MVMFLLSIFELCTDLKNLTLMLLKYNYKINFIKEHVFEICLN